MANLDIRKIKNEQKVPILVGLALFVLIVFPRLILICKGVSYFEDWNVAPYSHLESYRPVAAVELFLFYQLSHEMFLTTPLAKVLTAIFFSAGFTLLYRTVVNLGTNQVVTFVCLGMICIHPALNQILWGIMLTSALNFMLYSLGINLIWTSESARPKVIGILLLTIASLGNQLLVVIAPAFFLIDWYRKDEWYSYSWPTSEWFLKVLAAILPVFVSLVALLIIRNFFDITDFANRSISLSGTDNLSYFQKNFYVLTNIFANFYQAQIDLLLGEARTNSFLKPAVFTTVVVVSFFAFKTGINKGLKGVLAFGCVFLLSVAPYLATNSTPSGYRVTLLSLVVCAVFLSVLVSDAIKTGRAHKLAAIVFAACWVSLTFASTSIDLSIREYAWDNDERALEQLSASLADKDYNRIVLCELNDNSPRRSGILVSYNRTNEVVYSNLKRAYQPFTPYYVKSKQVFDGFTVVRSEERCDELCQTSWTTFNRGWIGVCS